MARARVADAQVFTVVREATGVGAEDARLDRDLTTMLVAEDLGVLRQDDDLVVLAVVLGLRCEKYERESRFLCLRDKYL